MNENEHKIHIHIHIHTQNEISKHISLKSILFILKM